ncbi:multidrug efflux SMR transporter [Mycobacterium sp. NAZ190054]|uniref:DMT family transporter n=1 Tax=Mycobacterium sp. NAZ190054 TaxID=1747766 RepID=UPI000797C425|nr:multidrug efflux SMR transporter [Mycobacterium sp. NAZ190054]KWX67888.1 ligand-binding protein SH3 [Mycobacterium sp. NAZ190054]
MPWTVLILSAVTEAVWATALGKSDGFTDPLFTAVFGVAMVLSIGGLGWAAKHIPIGSAYAVWTGLGAALTVGYAMATGAEAVSPAKVVFLTGIIVAVVGLKLLPTGPAEAAEADGRAPRLLEHSGR